MTTGLPLPLSSFVGRTHDIERVTSLLAKSRLVTLTGGGGIGKTRLAVTVAAGTIARFPDGVRLVELAAVSESARLWESVSATLGAGDRPGRSPADSVIDHLAQRETLLVLDNCEHLLDACAELAHTLLAACAGLSILATGQQALGVTGERVWRVGPLDLPGDDGASPEEADAVALFCERARAIDPEFRLDDATAPAVVEICTRLDGIPLAIEVAAARVQVLSVTELAAQLDRRLTVLTTGGRTAPARHRTLRAALDWSHDLLVPAEAMVLRRLAVFASGATLDAIRAVCEGGERQPDDLGGDGTPLEMLDIVAGLVAKSWLLVDHSGGGSRYRMLETVRDYAAERLTLAGERADMQARHATFFVALAERAEDELVGARQHEWLDALEADHDNTRAALGWALAGGHHEIALRLAGALGEFWKGRGHLQEGRQWLGAALSAGTSADHPAVLRAKVLRGAGSLAAMTGQRAEAVGLLEEALHLTRDAGDDAGSAHALHRLGLLAMLDRDVAAALPLLDEAVALARSAGDDSALAASLIASGQAHMFRRAPAEARRCYEECLEVAGRAGDVQCLGDAAGGLGWAVLAEGDYEQAERLLERALHQVRQVGAPYAVVLMLGFLSELARVHGDYATARGVAEEGLAIGRNLRAPFLMARCLGKLGLVALAEGDLVSARALYEEALSAGAMAPPRLGERRQALIGIAWVLMASGHLEEAGARLEEAMAQAVDAGDQVGMAAVRFGLGVLAEHSDDLSLASNHHHEALVLRHEAGDVVGVVDSLEALARLAARAGRHERTARLIGAARSLRDDHRLRYVRPPAQEDGYLAVVAEARGHLGDEAFQRECGKGSTMSIGGAVSYASRGRGTRDRGTKGWASLTATEREVVALIEQRLSSAEMAERLFVSPRTVQSHLTHIYAKLAVSSRRELAEEAARRSTPPSR